MSRKTMRGRASVVYTTLYGSEWWSGNVVCIVHAPHVHTALGSADFRMYVRMYYNTLHACKKSVYENARYVCARFIRMGDQQYCCPLWRQYSSAGVTYARAVKKNVKPRLCVVVANDHSLQMKFRRIFFFFLVALLPAKCVLFVQLGTDYYTNVFFSYGQAPRPSRPSCCI